MGKESGAGSIVATFYDICNKIWIGLPPTESLKSRIENTSGGIEASGKIPIAINGFGGHDDEERENEKLDNEKDC